jgi:hypothetical protein
MELQDFQGKLHSDPVSYTTSNEVNTKTRLLSSFAKRNKQIIIATLGPKGTSSDIYCSCFTKHILEAKAQCGSFVSYEVAERSIKGGVFDPILMAKTDNKNINFLSLSCFSVQQPS